MGARLSTMENYIGKKYGRLTVIADLGCISKGNRRMVTAVCECGSAKDYMMSRLKGGQTKSCGCILKEQRYGSDFIHKKVIGSKSRYCVSCKTNKPNSDFHKNGKRGVHCKCKDCMAAYKKKRYWDNHEVELAKMTQSRLKPENVLQRKGYYLKNKDEYRKRHLKMRADETRNNHRKKRNKEYHKKRYKTDPEYNILIKIRARIRSALSKQRLKKSPSDKTMAYLGCSYSFFKEHIESLFTEGMTWDGVLSGDIHLDHKRPCASFKLSDPEQQLICFNWCNVQPLWADDNLKKNATYQENA